jgi:hypothetical protein
MPSRTRTAQRRVTPSPAAIDRARKMQMTTIKRARSLGDVGNRLLDNAQNLLTVQWGAADWTSRAGILKTVDWLLRVALHPKPKSWKGVQ